MFMDHSDHPANATAAQLALFHVKRYLMNIATLKLTDKCLNRRLSVDILLVQIKETDRKPAEILVRNLLAVVVV